MGGMWWLSWEICDGSVGRTLLISFEDALTQLGELVDKLIGM
jgi:hypothetical protein